MQDIKPGDKVGIFSKYEVCEGVRILHFVGYAKFEGFFKVGDLVSTIPLPPLTLEQVALLVMKGVQPPQARYRFDDGTVFWQEEVEAMTVADIHKLFKQVDKVVNIDAATLRAEIDRVKSDFVEFAKAFEKVNVGYSSSLFN